MKKKLLVFMVITIMIGITACGNEETVTVEPPTTQAIISENWNTLTVKDKTSLKLPKEWKIEEKDDYYTITANDGTVKFVAFDASKYTKKKKKIVSFNKDDFKISYNSDMEVNPPISGMGYSNGATWSLRKITLNDEEKDRYILTYNDTAIIGINTDDLDDKMIDEFARKIVRPTEEK